MFSTAFLDLPPFVAAAGTVRLPGSKSISNRVLLLAALAEGTTTVHDLLDSDDTRVMLDALRALGCGVDLSGSTVRIHGLKGRQDLNGRVGSLIALPNEAGRWGVAVACRLANGRWKLQECVQVKVDNLEPCPRLGRL